MIDIVEQYQKKFEFYKNIVDVQKIMKIKEQHKNYSENDKLILEIELVPTSCWLSNIRSNVKNSEWDRIRFVTGGIANFKCEICNERGSKHPVECHEVWKYDEIKKKQSLLKFQSICPLCHQVKHLGFTKTVLGKEFYNRAVERFMRINNLSELTAKELIREAIEKWKQRSESHWELDISLLSNYNIKISNTDREVM